MIDFKKLSLKKKSAKLIKDLVPTLKEVRVGSVVNAGVIFEVHICGGRSKYLRAVNTYNDCEGFYEKDLKEDEVQNEIHLEDVISACIEKYIDDTEYEFSVFFAENGETFLRRSEINSLKSRHSGYNTSKPFSGQSKEFYEFIVEILSYPTLTEGE